jgi:benzoate-CoA ligase
MPELSSAEHFSSPPALKIPRSYNAAYDLIERNLAAGRQDQVAFIDDRQAITFGELARRVNRFASGLGAIGVEREDRILLCLLDTIDWPTVFLGAIKAGVVPVCVNTLLAQADYDYMLRDSRAKALFVSRALFAAFDGLHNAIPSLSRVVISEAPLADGGDIGAILENGEDACDAADTSADDPCFWLYSSGSTGLPKGTVHCHSSLIQTAELYARPTLGIAQRDRTFSAAKLFFAYGLGNALSFPMAVGATSVLMAERPTPEAVFKRLSGELPEVADGVRPTIFYGVPTLYAGMLASDRFPSRERLDLRICASAGEALPERIGQRFTDRTGVEILDGIGSTEMLHIFLSNRRGQVRYGTTGVPVPGYELKLLADDGREVGAGEIGDLYIKGPTSALYYWNQREKSRQTFQGEWTRSGDKFIRAEDGYYTYAGRSDDMLKVSGQFVSPFEVESAIGTHEAVLEAAVIGQQDLDELIKPKAFVVLNHGQAPSEELAEAIKQHVKQTLAPFKYPRWIVFVEELPKTATGKIQRFKLRTDG